LFPNNFAEERARPPFMVYQRCLIVPLIQPSIPPRPPPDHSLAADSSLQLEPVPLRRNTHVRKPQEKYGFSEPLSLTATLASVPIPSLYKQAMEHKYRQDAIEIELLALEENQTWDIVPCPPSIKPLGSKFVFTIKLHLDGSID